MTGEATGEWDHKVLQLERAQDFRSRFRGPTISAVLV